MKPLFGNVNIDIAMEKQHDDDDDNVKQTAYDDIDLDELLSRRLRTRKFKRSFYEAPEFNQRLSAYDEKDMGQDAVLKCEIKGFPLPTIQWFKDDEEINDDNERYLIQRDMGFLILTVEKVNKWDEGTYKCRAENSEGATSTFCYISVKGERKPKKPKRRSTPSPVRNLVAFPPNVPTIMEDTLKEDIEEEEYSMLEPSPIDYGKIAKARSWPRTKKQPRLSDFKTKEDDDGSTSSNNGDDASDASDADSDGDKQREDLCMNEAQTNGTEELSLIIIEDRDSEDNECIKEPSKRQSEPEVNECINEPSKSQSEPEVNECINEPSKSQSDPEGNECIEEPCKSGQSHNNSECLIISLQDGREHQDDQFATADTSEHVYLYTHVKSAKQGSSDGRHLQDNICHLNIKTKNYADIEIKVERPKSDIIEELDFNLMSTDDHTIPDHDITEQNVQQISGPGRENRSMVKGHIHKIELKQNVKLQTLLNSKNITLLEFYTSMIVITSFISSVFQLSPTWFVLLLGIVTVTVSVISSLRRKI